MKLEPCKHLVAMLKGDYPGARAACHKCRLIALKLDGGELVVTPMIEARPLQNLKEFAR